MAQECPKSPETATMTQSELFRRYLDAPVRVNATTSSLIADPGKMSDTTARDCFLYYGYGHSFPSDYAEELIAKIESDECPLFEMDKIVRDLSDLMEAMNVLKNSFDRLAEVTRTKPPANNAPASVVNDWQDNPRYVLPLINQLGVEGSAV